MPIGIEHIAAGRFRFFDLLTFSFKNSCVFRFSQQRTVIRDFSAESPGGHGEVPHTALASFS